MTGFLLALPFLLASAALVAGLNWWLGGGPVKFTDLTRPAEFVHQVERTVDNARAVAVFRTRWEAGGHNVRALPVRPEPVQLHSWEDDGGAAA